MSSGTELVSDANINLLAGQLLELDSEIALAEENLKRMKKAREELARVKFPEAMEELGVWELKTPAGVKFTIKEKLYATVAKRNVEFCHGWLRNNGLGEIIKNEIKVTLGKDSDGVADKIIAQLEQLNATYVRSEAIHTATLKKVIGEILEKGDLDIDLDKFGVFEYKEVEIKLPK